jgi:flagellar biosynthetic protein FlhB
MAEQGTEAGTPLRKKKAREEGDSVRSRELLSAVAMTAGVLVLGAVAKSFVGSWRMVFERSLAAAAVRDDGGEMQWAMAVRRMIGPALLPLGLVMAASFAGALGVGIAQEGGIRLHPKAAGFKFERLNPAANLGQLFSLRGVARAVKSLLPAAAMVWLGWVALKALMVPMPVMSLARLPNAFGAAYSLALDAAWVTLAWSGLDYALEWKAWDKRMKMTRQQLKDESKEAMGNPQIKVRMWQVQHAMRRRKVKAPVAEANAAIANPTISAVGLEFSFGQDCAGEGQGPACGGDSRGSGHR